MGFKNLEEYNQYRIVLLEAIHKHSADFTDHIEMSLIKQYDLVIDLLNDDYIRGLLKPTMDDDSNKLDFSIVGEIRLSKKGLKLLEDAEEFDWEEYTNELAQ